MPDPLSNRASNRRVRDTGFFVAGLLVYWMLVSFFSWFHGENIVRLSPFFVGAAGFFLGVRAGALASVITICAHMVVFYQSGLGGAISLVRVHPAVNIGLVLLGPLAGYFRTKLQRTTGELEARDAELKQLEAPGQGFAEEKYRDLVEKVPAVVYVGPLDTRGPLLYASPKIEEFLGFAGSVWTTSPDLFDRLYHPEDAERVRLEFSRCVSAHERFVGEYRIRTQDGTVRWVHDEADVVCEKNGKPVFVQGVLYDITDRRTADAQPQTGGVTGVESAGDLAGTPDVEDAPPEPAPGPLTAVVAEDDPAIQRLIGEAMRSTGYDVLTANDGVEALEVAVDHGGPVHLLISSMVIPRLNGRELAAELRSRFPALKVLYISGYIGRASVSIAELGPGTSFLSKPFTAESLSRKIRLLLDAPATATAPRQPRTRALHHPSL
jgi:PAS domain S-box-containing protein